MYYLIYEKNNVKIWLIDVTKTRRIMNLFVYIFKNFEQDLLS